MELKDYVLTVMKARGLSVTDLARMAGVNKSSLSRFLNGKTRYSRDEFKQKLLVTLGGLQDEKFPAEAKFALAPVENSSKGLIQGIWAMCETLRILGNYSSIEAAMKVAIGRELEAQKSGVLATTDP